MKKQLYLLLTALMLPVVAGAQTTSAQSSLSFRVVIPLFVQIIEDKHPMTVDGLAVQTLALRTNSKTTCVVLTAQGYSGSWQSTTSDNNWTSLKTPTEHRYCTNKQGNLSLNVTHDFKTPSQTWPVQMTITSQP